MAARMSMIATEKLQKARESKGWLGTDIGKGSVIAKAEEYVRRWEEEEVQIELKKQKTLPLTQPLKAGVHSWSNV